MRYFLRRQSCAVANTKTVLAYARGLQPFFFKVHADDGNLAVKVQICVALPFAQGATQTQKVLSEFCPETIGRELAHTVLGSLLFSVGAGWVLSFPISV